MGPGHGQGRGHQGQPQPPPPPHGAGSTTAPPGVNCVPAPPWESADSKRVNRSSSFLIASSAIRASSMLLELRKCTSQTFGKNGLRAGSDRPGGSPTPPGDSSRFLLAPTVTKIQRRSV